jgi:hypothetical protein
MSIHSTLCSLGIITLVTLGGAAACSNGVPLGPSNAGSAKTNTPAATPTPAPAAPTPTVASAVAYTPDLQPIFNSDCVPCHGSRSAAARYSMSTYASVMAAVTPRSASSPLVIVTQPGGVMYSFFSGDRAAKAAMVKTWILNGAPQNR